MNARMVVVWIASCATIVVLVFPPWVWEPSNDPSDGFIGDEMRLMYAPFFLRPETTHPAHISGWILVFELLGIWLVTAILLLFNSWFGKPARRFKHGTN